MTHYPGEPEPTVPFERPATTPAPQAYPVRYDEPYGYPPQPLTGYAVVQPPPYGRYPEPLGYPGYPVDPRQQAYQNALYSAQKSRVAAGLLALFLGCFGIHNFYLGRTGIGVLQLLLTVLSLFVLSPLVGVWVLIEAILILSRSPSFVTDAKGIPLRD